MIVLFSLYCETSNNRLGIGTFFVCVNERVSRVVYGHYPCVDVDHECW